jgi:glyoxylase I family protein
MNQAGAQSSGNETQTFAVGFWGVRYQVKDVARSVAFYTNHLGFKLDQQNYRHSARCQSAI